jgi:uncharacterized protein (DUF362 family)
MSQSPAQARVAIARAASAADEKAVRQAVEEAVEQSCNWAALVRGKRVVIKPNVFAPYPPPTTTDPRVVAALIGLAREAGARHVIVAEGRSVSTARFRSAHNTTAACCAVTGMARAVAKAGAEFVALEDDELVETALPHSDLLKSAHVARTILEAEALINVPAMKIHSLTLVTLCIKNLHGIICDVDKVQSHCYREQTLARKLVDLLLIRRPDLNVVAGIVGQEADHAASGRPVEVGAIIAGEDAVATDAVTSAVMGLDPLAVDTTRIAAERGLGIGDLDRIVVIGATIEQVRRPFARPDVAISEAAFPGLKVYAGDYCLSCAYYTRRGLDALKAKGLLDEKHPLSLVIGLDPEVPENIPGKVVLVGDCALSSESVKPLRNGLLIEDRLRAIYACPPMELRIRAEELLS